MNMGWWDQTPRTELQLLRARIRSLSSQVDSTLYSKRFRDQAYKQLKAAERELCQMGPRAR